MNDLANWRKLTRHPLSAIFPDMSEVEFESLLADMKQHGYDQKQQVWLFEGKVLDGWHRQRAAVMNDKMPTYDTYKGSDPELFVIRRNLNRRHLDTTQRASVAAKLTQNKGNLEWVRINAHPRTQGEAAELLNVSRRVVQQAAKVLEHGTPELIEEMSAGNITVKDSLAIAQEPPKVQRRAIKAVKSGKARTAKAAVGKLDEPPKPAHIPGAIRCPMCGVGEIPKENRDELWDAIVKVTHADSKLNASQIGKACKNILGAGYTAADVLKLPPILHRVWPKVPCTIGVLEKYVSWVKDGPPENLSELEKLRRQVSA